MQTRYGDVAVTLVDAVATVEVQRPPNTYQAAVVKRADGCIAGAGWPSVEQTVKRLCQAIGADLISVAGHSRWAAPNTY